MNAGLCPVKIRMRTNYFYLYIGFKNFTSTRYRFGDSQYPHFITFAVINWIDALSRPLYKDIIIDSVKHCQQEKGLIINGWSDSYRESNHVHLIARSSANFQLADTMRQLKKFTSKKIEEAVRQNAFASRREWLLWIACPGQLAGFKRASEENSNNKYFQFWQEDNHRIELYGYETLKHKLNYVHENPIRAGFVYEFWHYKYSSAIDYCTTSGKINLEMV